MNPILFQTTIAAMCKGGPRGLFASCLLACVPQFPLLLLLLLLLHPFLIEKPIFFWLLMWREDQESFTPLAAGWNCGIIQPPGLSRYPVLHSEGTCCWTIQTTSCKPIQ